MVTKIEETYDDGSPKLIHFYKQINDTSVLIGEEHYYENGNLKMKGNYNPVGQREGKWTYWYLNGNKWSEGYFVNGLEDSLKTVWHENGNIHYQGFYHMGQRTGTWEFYELTGDKLKEISYGSSTY